MVNRGNQHVQRLHHSPQRHADQLHGIRKSGAKHLRRHRDLARPPKERGAIVSCNMLQKREILLIRSAALPKTMNVFQKSTQSGFSLDLSKLCIQRPSNVVNI